MRDGDLSPVLQNSKPYKRTAVKLAKKYKMVLFYNLNRCLIGKAALKLGQGISNPENEVDSGG